VKVHVKTMALEMVGSVMKCETMTLEAAEREVAAAQGSVLYGEAGFTLAGYTFVTKNVVWVRPL
jgi:hypothetical protein